MQFAANPKTRLFNSDVLLDNSELWLSGDQAKYVARVLRLKLNDDLVVFDGKGGQFAAVIKEFERDRVLLKVGRRQSFELESPLAIDLVQGLSRSGRMDIVVQKSTELGVRRIWPVITEHSIVKLDSKKALRRREHWLRVSRSACEQCGRNTVPDIEIPQALNSWLGSLAGDGTTKVMLDPTSGTSIATLSIPDKVVTVLVGPESGLSDFERQRCKDVGFEAVSLGPRILRTETAAVAVLAVLQSVWGDLG